MCFSQSQVSLQQLVAQRLLLSSKVAVLAAKTTRLLRAITDLLDSLEQGEADEASSTPA